MARVIEFAVVAGTQAREWLVGIVQSEEEAEELILKLIDGQGYQHRRRRAWTKNNNRQNYRYYKYHFVRTDNHF
jgi:hypothetical protein